MHRYTQMHFLEDAFPVLEQDHREIPLESLLLELVLLIFQGMRFAVGGENMKKQS